MELRDTKGDILNPGDKVVYEDYGVLRVGWVMKYCNSTLSIKSKPEATWFCRIIQHRHCGSKIYKLEDAPKVEKKVETNEKFAI